MREDQIDMNAALMLDGNAVAGQLARIFGRDMTTAVTKCAGCTSEAEMGALMAFTQAPGVVLRCPVCDAVIARIVQTPASIYLDVRGAAFFRIRSAA